MEVTSIPLMVDLRNQKAVVVGGGSVAQKRAKILYENNALVTVVSPDLTNELEDMWRQSNIKWKRKKVGIDDLQGAYLVVIATNDSEVNEQVFLSASEVPLINVAGDAEKGNLQFANFFTRGKLTIAISTNGASPNLSSRIKKDLEEQYDEAYEQYVDFLYECRQRIKHSSMPKESQRDILRTLLNEPYIDKTQQDQCKDWLEHMVEGGQRNERTK